MPRTKRLLPPTLISILVACPACMEKFEVMADKLTWSGGESPCDLCGSHGNVKVDLNSYKPVTCPSCGAKMDNNIELESW